MDQRQSGFPLHQCMRTRVLINGIESKMTSICGIEVMRTRVLTNEPEKN